MAYQDGIETIEFNTAQDFLTFLRPSGKFNSLDWIFRGHANEQYNLLPNLFRDPVGELVQKHYDLVNKEANENLIFTFKMYIRNGSNFRKSRVFFSVEHKLLREFAIKADRVGLPVPGLDTMLNASLDLYSPTNSSPFLVGYDSSDNFDLNAVYEFVKENKGVPPTYAGLAQHHGVPTRLLDFSFNSMKAIYFAVTNSAPSRICIWAINTLFFNDEYFWRWRHNTTEAGVNNFAKYSMFVMPNSSNKYMHQQQGLFVYPRFPFEFNFENGRFPDLRDFIKVLESWSKVEEPRAFKLVLPEQHFFDLKELIKREGLTLSTMMPTFDNVAREMKNDVGIY
ncbi:FRG domain-containing protein [Dyadobacter endophyticus]|uniref:FRG domain-containing protein n=1 Tax=Dyadobacter endophyticus TaxID=1749036 RepID=UPI003CF469EF